MSLLDDHPTLGHAVTPGDPRYDAARRLWNGAVDRRPRAILQPPDTAGVAAAVLRARDEGAALAVRGGGHSMAGLSMAGDDGVTIDLSRLRAVRVDRAARTVHVGGGALLSDVARAAEPHGWCIPYGHISHTGVGGFTLGGGLGWVSRRHGLAVDALRRVELVTAQGEVVCASAEEHPDLFWALRGGGGNFGIATRFEFAACDHGTALAGTLLFGLDDAAAALRASRDLMEDAPDRLTVYEVFMTAPPAGPFPPELLGRPALALGIVWTGDPAEGERAVAPLRALPGIAYDDLAPRPLTAVQAMLDPTAPHGLRYSSRAHWLAALPDEAIDALVEHHRSVPSPMSQLITARMGGAVSAVPRGATAYAHRDANRLLWVAGGWEDAADDDVNRAWVRRAHELMAPWSTGGVYVNALGDGEESRARAGYDDPTWERLREVKAAWDPGNVFRLNANVPPA